MLTIKNKRILKLLINRVQYTVVPQQQEHLTNINDFCVYILPKITTANLLILQHYCKKMSLPDPLLDNKINGKTLPRVISLANNIDETNHILLEYAQLIQQQPDLQVTILPFSIFWGKTPEINGKLSKYSEPSYLQQCWLVFSNHIDTFICCNTVMSLTNLLANNYEISQIIKIRRLVNLLFARHKIAIVGPQITKQQVIFEKILAQNSIQKLIEDEIRAGKINAAEATQKAIDILKEITADFNFRRLKLANRFLTWLWHKLYRGINVYHTEEVQQLALAGQEIVYVPCHRSHIDYLLLSHILYHNGLALPQIAAGINLNFWPVGKWFRNSGAFFIRRSFKGDRLYSVLFREYLTSVLAQGTPVEFFIEGGRSRTGKLLSAKTGLLSMVLQAMAQTHTRPIAIVPVYFGYEHVIEADTYFKELQGQAKEKENAGLVLKVIRKLKNFGQASVSFGTPIKLTTYLNQNYPLWHTAEEQLEVGKSKWLNAVTPDLANQILININQTAVVNAINLPVIILQHVENNQLSEQQLIKQIKLYKELLINAKYHQRIQVTNRSAKAILAQAKKLNKIQLKPSNMVGMEKNYIAVSRYYTNNIKHLFLIPSLLIRQIEIQPHITVQKLQENLYSILPLLEKEYFINFNTREEFNNYINTIIQVLLQQNLLHVEAEQLTLQDTENETQALAHISDAFIMLYYIMLTICSNKQLENISSKKEQCQQVLKKLVQLQPTILEFYNKDIVNSSINILKNCLLIDNDLQIIEENTTTLYDNLNAWQIPSIKLEIDNLIEQENNNILVTDNNPTI